MVGRIKWFDNEAGFGFIEYEKNNDIFVHYSNILQDGFKTLEAGQMVKFDLLETSKGLQALNITKLDDITWN